MRLELPFPPSTNTYWRHIPDGRRVRSLISASGRKYRRDVSQLVMLQRAQANLAGPLRVVVKLSPPDRKRRDLDNFAGKALFDALQHAGVYQDDSQIRESHNFMLDPVQGGNCVVTLESIEHG